MKKLIASIMVAILVLAVSAVQPLPQTEASVIRVLIDGQAMQLDVAPVIRAGRVLIPFRAVFEAFGATVGWDAATNTVTGRRGDVVISLVLENRTATVSGNRVELDVAPFATGGRTLVPLRFVAENLGAEVSWDEANRTVIIVRPVAIRRVRIADNAQSQKIAQFANQDAFITPAELNMLRQRNERDVVVLGVLNPTSALIPLHIVRSPIADSFSVWRPDYSGTNSPAAVAPVISGMALSQSTMEDLLSRAGATPSSMIVVYAADAHHDAARFMWQIRQLGHRDVRYLDGGLNAWHAANLPTGRFARLAEQTRQTDYRAPRYDLTVNNATLQMVIAALHNPREWVVIDTRSAAEFGGRPSGSSRGAYGLGRLVGSVHLEWTHANAPDLTLRSREELAAIFGEIIRGRRVIVFCQSGVRSSHTTIVLRDVLGLQSVYNYDGSWVEWSYVASEVSANLVPAALRTQVHALTELWTDNRGELR